jgi:hypothetical protein
LEQAASGAKSKKPRLQIARFGGCKSKLVGWVEAFDAVEFFDFPVHGEFHRFHFVTRAAGLEKSFTGFFS